MVPSVFAFKSVSFLANTTFCLYLMPFPFLSMFLLASFSCFYIGAFACIFVFLLASACFCWHLRASACIFMSRIASPCLLVCLCRRTLIFPTCICVLRSSSYLVARLDFKEYRGSLGWTKMNLCSVLWFFFRQLSWPVWLTKIRGWWAKFSDSNNEIERMIGVCAKPRLAPHRTALHEPPY